MISKDKLVLMLKLQDKLNQVVNPDWINAGYPWHRAILVETIEAMDHYGWKWWKAQAPNVAQARMELVDIWHFMLSMALENAKGDYETAATTIEGIFYVPEKPTDKDTLILFDLLAGYAAEGKICVPAYVHLMQELSLTWDGLYTAYVGKNVLNVFRQDHGYRAGSYRKNWDGLEDNEVLTQLMHDEPDATPEELYHCLSSAYDIVLYNEGKL